MIMHIKHEGCHRLVNANQIKEVWVTDGMLNVEMACGRRLWDVETMKEWTQSIDDFFKMAVAAEEWEKEQRGKGQVGNST